MVLLSFWMALLGPVSATSQETPVRPAPPAPRPLPDPETPADLAAPPADAVKTGSGLVTKAVRDGTGSVHPDDNDMVTLHYIGWTPQGAKFRSTYGRGKPSSFKVSTAVPAWQEAVQMMVVGERRRLWLPDHLAPKSSDTPRGPVVFDFELLDVRVVPNPPSHLGEPPEDAERTLSGAATRRLFEGTGDSNPGDTDVALMNWTGWTVDGRTFGSTLYRGRPTAFPLDKVLPPFADAVRLMVEGEKRQIWIPEHLAAGQWPGAPAGPLIFEVELLKILPAEILAAGRPATGGSGP